MTLALVSFAALAAGLLGAWVYAGFPRIKLLKLSRLLSVRAFVRDIAGLGLAPGTPPPRPRQP
jgi:hypothetical protein